MKNRWMFSVIVLWAIALIISKQLSEWETAILFQPTPLMPEHYKGKEEWNTWEVEYIDYSKHPLISPNFFWNTDARSLKVKKSIGYVRRSKANLTTGILCFTGNSGNGAIWTTKVFGPMFENMQNHLYVYEYPSFGNRKNETMNADTIHMNFLRELHAAMQDQRALYNIQQWIVIGNSMGTGFACDLAENYVENVSALILLVPYASIQVAINHFTKGSLGFMTSYKWLDNVKNLKWLNLLVDSYAFFAEYDEILPIETHLTPLIPVLKEYEIVKRHHNDVMFDTNVIRKIRQIVTTYSL